MKYFIAFEQSKQRCGMNTENKNRNKQTTNQHPINQIRKQENGENLISQQPKT
jgi:hypothetical protein